MTTDRVREFAISEAVGYMAGLVVLLVWPDRQSVSQPAVVFVGLAVAILVGLAIESKAFHRSLLEEFLAPPRRPWRYSLPAAIGFFGSLAYVNSTRDGADWAIGAHAVGLALVLAGYLVCDLWWATATKPPA